MTETGKESVFAEAMGVINRLEKSPVRNGKQVIEVQSSSVERNIAVATLVVNAYALAVAQPSANSSSLFNSTTNETKIALPVPDGMERMPVHGMRQALSSLQASFTQNLRDNTYQVISGDEGNKPYFALLAPNTNFAMYAYMMMDHVAAAHGHKDACATVLEGLSVGKGAPTYPAILITPAARKAILDRETPPPSPRPDRN